MASPAGDNSHLFAGDHFLLIGFDSVSKSQYRSKLVQSGGTDAMLFGGGCTHVVDDPVCALARAQGSKVVSEIWVDDSLDRGVLADADRVIYWPARDLKGIPGIGSLQICLTGYQKKDRKDIMKMVSLMCAQFSKRLLAPSVTHLVCYKFEGDKYKLAKSLGIKIVNHRWLEDCLKSWEILPIEDYSERQWLDTRDNGGASHGAPQVPDSGPPQSRTGKRAMRKAKSSSKVLAAALALLNHAHPEVGTDFLECDDLPPDIQAQTAKYAEVAEAFVASCSSKFKGDRPRQS